MQEREGLLARAQAERAQAAKQVHYCIIVWLLFFHPFHASVRHPQARALKLNRIIHHHTTHTPQAESEAGAAGKKGKEITGKEKALQTLGEERTRLTATRDEKQDERKVRYVYIFILYDVRSRCH